MANFITKLTTWLSGVKVGQDQFGNEYYTSKATPAQGRRKRWVIYKSMDEASLVPPEFHAWLHYTNDEFPDGQESKFRPDWQKAHRANLTGTDLKYQPARHKATGDYQPWHP